MCASRALLYHLQGSFAETHGREEQLHWIQTNARDVFELGGLQEIFTACKRACYKHDWVSALPDAPAPGTQPMVTPEGEGRAARGGERGDHRALCAAVRSA